METNPILTEENFRCLSDYIKKYGQMESQEVERSPVLIIKDWGIKYIKHADEETLSFFSKIGLVGGLILKNNQVKTFSLIKFEKENKAAQKRIERAFEELTTLIKK